MSKAFEDVKQQILLCETQLTVNQQIGFSFSNFGFEQPIEITHIWEVESGFILFYGPSYQIVQSIIGVSFALSPQKSSSGKRITFESPY